MLLEENLFERHMLFYTFEDFMKQRFYIKANLSTKDNNYIICYRMYIHSRPWVKDYYRGIIWDYLNDYLDEEQLTVEFDKYKAKHGDVNE